MLPEIYGLGLIDRDSTPTILKIKKLCTTMDLKIPHLDFRIMAPGQHLSHATVYYGLVPGPVEEICIPSILPSKKLNIPQSPVHRLAVSMKNQMVIFGLEQKMKSFGLLRTAELQNDIQRMIIFLMRLIIWDIWFMATEKEISGLVPRKV